MEINNFAIAHDGSAKSLARQIACWNASMGDNKPLKALNHSISEDPANVEHENCVISERFEPIFRAFLKAKTDLK